MQRVLITGANRGIGLEFARQYVRSGWDVYAATRRPGDAEELTDLRQQNKTSLHILKMDITDEDTIDQSYEELRSRVDSLDLLLNNAGVYGSNEEFDRLTPLDFLSVFETNCVGAFQVTQTFLPAVQAATGKVVFVTSLMGSVDDNRSGGSYPYRVSKAALNMLGKTFHEDYADEGIHSLLLHPGWVKTRMGGSGAKISPEESVEGMREVIENLDHEMSGQFRQYDGEKLPW